MVMRVAERCKTPAEMSRELGLDWRGYLIADDKRVPVRGKDVAWYAGVDKTGDIVHAEMMVHPTVSGMAEFFETVRDDLQYRMRGLTTDQEMLFDLAYRRGYDELRRMRLELRPVEILRKRIHRVLFSRSYTIARARWAAFARHALHTHRAHQIVVEFIRRHWQRLTVHYHHAGMPKHQQHRRKYHATDRATFEDH